ncbi:MAG: hypothetical protein WCR98_05625, partial [Saccharofermentanales bacterium]
HFTRRYAHWVERDTNEKEKTDARIRFIEMVLDQTISIKDKTRAQLKKELLSHKFEEELIDTLLAMPIYHLCKDKLKELMDKSKKLAKDIETWKKMNINKAYIKDLEAI